MQYLCNRKRTIHVSASSSINNKTIKIMDCIFRITEVVKKVGFAILLAELAVIAYMNVM